MSGPVDRLEDLLSRLASRRAREAEGPALKRRRSSLSRRATVLAQRDEREDPLTGHRGVAEGLQVLLRAGDWLVDLQLRDERDGVVLRGQLLPVVGEPSSPAGALVHVRAAGEATLACVDAAGEFVVRGLPAAAVDSLHLELEDGVHELPWPGSVDG